MYIQFLLRICGQLFFLHLLHCDIHGTCEILQEGDFADDINKGFPAEDHAEEFRRIFEASLWHGRFFAEPVILRPEIFIRENLVRLADCLESLVCGGIIGILVCLTR